MGKFLIRTHSSFENIYLVEADSAELAMQKIEDPNAELTFVQKHIGEPIEQCTEVTEEYCTQDLIRNHNGYF